METLEKKQQPKVTGDGRIRGRWQLKYKLVNPNGIAGFSGRLVSSYADPLTGKERHLFNMEGRQLPGFLIESISMNFDPMNNPMHANIVDWLIGHPEVGIQNDHASIDARYMQRKISNPRITLVNLDHQDVVHLEEEQFVDKLIGKISEDEGKYAFSREKLRFVLSKLGLEYREERLMTNAEKESQKLRSRLKKHIRSSYQNAKKVSMILENLDNAKDEYEIKEMVRLQILSVNNGMYMYKGNPLGVSMESVIKYLRNNPEFHVELSEVLTAVQKQELERLS